MVAKGGWPEVPPAESLRVGEPGGAAAARAAVDSPAGEETPRLQNPYHFTGHT